MAEYYMTKQPGGVFSPEDEIVAESLKRFKNGETYKVEIKLSRNPAFHRKAFAFFNFCFDCWSGCFTEYQNMDEEAQFETFRKHLTVLAGYRIVTYTIDGRARVEAMSLSYESMKQKEFEQCYKALINAALKHIFNETTDQSIIDRLYSFF